VRARLVLALLVVAALVVAGVAWSRRHPSGPAGRTVNQTGTPSSGPPADGLGPPAAPAPGTAPGTAPPRAWFAVTLAVSDDAAADAPWDRYGGAALDDRPRPGHRGYAVSVVVATFSGTPTPVRVTVPPERTGH
jgi:hypothetical protein